MTEGELRSELTALKRELTDTVAAIRFGKKAGQASADKAFTNIARAAQSVFEASAALKRVYSEDCAFAYEADAFLKKAEAL